MWKCPKCRRKFKTRNQWHSCAIVKVDDLFENKLSLAKKIYNELLERCKAFSSFEIDTTKSCIYFVAHKRFIAIKPQKNGIITEFVLNRSIDVFPVIKISGIGKFKYAHRVMLDRVEDVTDELMRWVEEAYTLQVSD